jgi:hypothetical protein|tara:strand:+ start:130 stop:615 length:486 start_codon:yes stop_codon:yes gene_type:complete
MDRLSPKQLRDIQSAVQDVYPEQEVEENYSELDQQVAEILVEFVKSLDEEQIKTIRQETLDEGVAGQIVSFAGRNIPRVLKAITGFGRTGRVADLQKAATGAATASTIQNPVKVGQDILGGVENVTRGLKAFSGQGVPAKGGKYSENRDDYELRNGKWYRK